MRANVSESLRRSQELSDLRIVVEATLTILVTWLALGWTLDHPITQADGSWLVAPYTDSLLHAGGDWTKHLYRFGVLGGSDMHAFGGTLPLVQGAAWLGLSTTTTLNLVTMFIQLVFAVFGIRLAEALATTWRGEPRVLTGGQRVLAVWLIGFAPLLGNRLAIGHENLLLGLLPLCVVLSLLWQVRAGRTTAVAYLLGAFAIANGVSGLGAQSLVFSAVFGMPLLVVSLWRWPVRRLAILEIAVVALAGLAVVLPRLVPMVAHALGPDATRGLGATVSTPYGASPVSDWLTSIPWTIGAQLPGNVHEHNYPLGPLVLVLALAWPRGASRALLWTVAATFVAAALYASTDVSLPVLTAFRCPSRAAMIPVLLVAPLAVACALARLPAVERQARNATSAVIALGLLAIAFTRAALPWPREVLAWLVAGGACYLLVRERFLFASAALATVAVLGVLAFDERIPRYVPVEPIERTPAQLRTAVAPELRSALDRVVLPDAPPPYDMSTAFAARVPSVDGIWYPPRRFLDLLSAYDGKPLPITTAVFRLSRNRAFPLIATLYNVRLAVRGLGSAEPKLEVLPAPAGPAWFPERVVTIDRADEMMAMLRTPGTSPAKTAWVLRSERPSAMPETCSGAELDSVATDNLGQTATIAISASQPCVLIVSTNYTSTLRAGPLPVFPIDIALTGIVVPAGTSTIVLAPQVEPAGWALVIAGLAALALAIATVRAVVRHRRGA